MTSNPNYKPSEGKREEFRKYLEKNGIMDALTKVLVNLYEEVDKPENALQYIIDKLSIQAGHETHATLQTKLTETEARIKELEEQLEQGAVKEEQPPEEPTGEPTGEEGIPDEALDPEDTDDYDCQ